MTRRERRRWALARQLTRLDRRLAALRALSHRLSWARLILFIVGSVLSAVLFFLEGPLTWLVSLAVWAAPFAILVAHHRRIEAGISRFSMWRKLKQEHLARMELDWSQLPPAAALPAPPQTHPFANDLDLYGEQSLHRLIDTAVSFDGSLRLQQRLLDTNPLVGQVRERRALVQALRPLRLFRDRLSLQALIARREGESWRAERLLAWITADSHRDDAALRTWVVGLALLGVLNLALLMLSPALSLPPVWAAGVGIYFVLYTLQGRTASRLFQEAMSLQDALRQLATVFAYLERPHFRHVQPLHTLCAPFRHESQPPSQFLHRLGRLVAAAGASRNPVMWFLLNAFFPWDLFFAHRLRVLRQEIAGRLPTWLDVWFELEAASALANFGYLNPEYVFATVELDGGKEAPFMAVSIGHPLIAHEQRVCNDFAVSEMGQVHLITGSNMAGKSSFLRTVGVNLCLAYAGAPVSAVKLQTRLFRLFTAIRVTDSVTDGISYFYAEVKRLKALHVALEDDDPRPLFFLIDEIFRGTNNRERLLGSRAYIRELVGKNGVGLIATHDLELVHLAEEMAPVLNYHFRDSIRKGRMVFDYHLRPGPSPTTNALKVMIAEGLPVPPDLVDN